MLKTTQGFVLRTVKYSDNSVIATIYTKAWGIRAFILNKGGGKKKSSKSHLVQPMSWVELTAYHKPSHAVQRIREINAFYLWKQIQFDPARIANTIFIAELIYRSVKEEEANQELYAFISNSLQLLDEEEKEIANFHLVFMLELTKYLGFYPRKNFSAQTISFDLFEGIFVSGKLQTKNTLSEQLSKSLTEIMNITLKEQHIPKFGKKTRTQLFQSLSEYYKLHLDGMGELKAYELLGLVKK